MLQQAIDAEAEGFLSQQTDHCDEQGRRQAVRNGRLPASGPVPVRWRPFSLGCGIGRWNDTAA